MIESSKNKYDLDAQSGVANFSKAYIKPHANERFFNLQKEAFERAKKRRGLIDDVESRMGLA